MFYWNSAVLEEYYNMQLTRELRLGGGVLAVALGTGFAAGRGGFAAALDLDCSTLGGGEAGVRVGR